MGYIETPKESRGLGLASKALKEITNAADKFGVIISGDVVPKGDMNQKSLFKWV